MSELPETLYKYRDWGNENHKRILTHNEIYFASPKDFNDPFDCNILIRYDLINKQQLISIAKNDGINVDNDKRSYFRL